MRRKHICSITTPILHKSSLNLKMTYCMFHFINNGKKSSNSEQTKDKANPNDNYIVQTSWTFLRFIYRVCRLCQPFKVSKLSFKVNNLTFMLQKYL